MFYGLFKDDLAGAHAWALRDSLQDTIQISWTINKQKQNNVFLIVSSRLSGQPIGKTINTKKTHRSFPNFQVLMVDQLLHEVPPQGLRASQSGILFQASFPLKGYTNCSL